MADGGTRLNDLITPGSEKAEPKAAQPEVKPIALTSFSHGGGGTRLTDLVVREEFGPKV